MAKIAGLQIQLKNENDARQKAKDGSASPVFMTLGRNANDWLPWTLWER